MAAEALAAFSTGPMGWNSSNRPRHPAASQAHWPDLDFVRFVACCFWLGLVVCAGPLIAVAWLAITGAWTDYLGHIYETRLAGYLGNTVIVGLVAQASPA